MSLLCSFSCWPSDEEKSVGRGGRGTPGSRCSPRCMETSGGWKDCKSAHGRIGKDSLPRRDSDLFRLLLQHPHELRAEAAGALCQRSASPTGLTHSEELFTSFFAVSLCPPRPTPAHMLQVFRSPSPVPDRTMSASRLRRDEACQQVTSQDRNEKFSVPSVLMMLTSLCSFQHPTAGLRCSDFKRVPPEPLGTWRIRS